MKLEFNIAKIPRTVTKKEWKELWHWKRVTEKGLLENEKELIAALRDMITYGTGALYDAKRIDVLEKLVNPPILLGPYQ